MIGSTWNSQEEKPILDNTRYNGRMNIIDNPPTLIIV